MMCNLCWVEPYYILAQLIYLENFLEKKYEKYVYISHGLSPPRAVALPRPRIVVMEPSFRFWALEPCPFFVAHVP